MAQLYVLKWVRVGEISRSTERALFESLKESMTIPYYFDKADYAKLSPRARKELKKLLKYFADDTDILEIVVQ